MSHIVIQDALYNAKSVRELDRLALQQLAIPSIILMKRAARAAFEELLEAWGNPSLVTVFCGSGNNAGDGYIVAALAAEKGIAARVIELAAVENLSADAALARDYSEKSGVTLQGFDAEIELYEGVIVDALLGTGFKKPLREQYAEAINSINNAALPILSIDLPSGLCSDTGSAADAAVKADISVTFIAAKQGMFTGRGPALCGEVIYHSLNIGEALFDQQPSSSQLMDLDDLLEQYPDRDADAYKNQFGHTMVIGGDHGYGGAASMAAESALAIGSGLVSVATRPEHVSAILARQPEVMASGVISGQELEPLLDKPTVLVIGPGLGRSPWSEQMLQKAAATGLPMVVDADALNIIAEGRVVPNPDGSRWVMTPHPAEAARLLNISVDEVQADRFSAVRELQKKFNAVVLLKGAGTLIASTDNGQVESQMKVCPYGNPSMATAGMGDMLSGIIGGLLAQGLESSQAAQLGCCLHSASADLAVEERGARGLVATDLKGPLMAILNGADL
jgi:hydroxyethylthiazole kinase-like uncharacterized protein yjeF